MTLGLTSLCGAVIGAFVFGLIGIEKSWGFSIFGVHVIRHPVNGSLKNLAVYEVIGLILFVVGGKIDDAYGCTLIGAVTHFFWLGSMLWLGFIIIDLATQTTKLFDGLKPAGKYVPTTVWKEVHYTLLQCLGVGVPSIAVIIGLLNPAPECGELDGHGYGGGFCFINESAYLIGTFYLPAIFTGVFALYSLLYWSTKIREARDNVAISDIMLDKISNDMTGSGVLLVTGFIAYAAGAAIDPANPSTSEELESVFCAFIVIHSLVAGYYFVISIHLAKSNSARASTSTADLNVMLSSADDVYAMEGGRRPDGKNRMSVMARAVNMTVDDLQNMARAMQTCDGADDGIITREEFTDLWHTLHPHRIKDMSGYCDQIFDTFDEDRSGTISIQEYTTYLAIASDGTMEQRLTALFKVFDINNDGGLSLAETIDMITVVMAIDKSDTGTDLQPDQLAEMIHMEVDVDGDGNIDLNEFIRMGENEDGVLYNLVNAPFIEVDEDESLGNFRPY